MGQTIVTFCDQHMTEDDQQVAGQPYRIGHQLPGETWTWVEVDLCPGHAEGLMDSVLTLWKYGRTFQPEDHGPTQVLTCPECGKAYRSKSGLNGHRHKEHPDAFLAPDQGHTCPECGRGFAKPQGLSMHRRRSHQGYDPNA
jgi:uncharacterized C2H2 Zn-finger protein